MRRDAEKQVTAVRKDAEKQVKTTGREAQRQAESLAQRVGAMLSALRLARGGRLGRHRSVGSTYPRPVGETGTGEKLPR